MGITTRINEKIKLALVSPFWNIVSPDNRNRLYIQLIEKINCFYYGNNGKYVPDKYLIGVSQKTYRKIKNKKEILLRHLKNDIEEYFTVHQLNKKNVTIDFTPLSYLKDREVRIFCFFSEESDLVCNRKKYYLKLLGQKDRMWTLDRPGEYIIGRSEEAEIHIAHPYVSALHAKVVYTAHDNLTISDCGSKNGTYINNKNSPVGHPKHLAPGDKILIGIKGRIKLQLSE